VYPDWADVAAQMVAILRFTAGRDPADAALAALVAELSAQSVEFGRMWADYRVFRHTHGTKRFHHEAVGTMSINAPPAELVARLADIVDVQAEMLVPAVVQALAEIVEDLFRVRDRAAQQLEVEVVVGGRAEVGQLQVAVRPLLQHAEVELLEIPGFRRVEVGHPQPDMMAAHRGERAGRVRGGR
jgi:hypothetical protein